MENSPWARRRGLRGPGAVAGLYQAWEAFVDAIYGRYPFPKLMVTDPQHDWPAALARIGAAICGRVRTAQGLRARTLQPTGLSLAAPPSSCGCACRARISGSMSSKPSSRRATSSGVRGYSGSVARP